VPYHGHEDLYAKIEYIENFISWLTQNSGGLGHEDLYAKIEYIENLQD